jgi:HPt (histidine-containing phosphotransfer) domain-containing protein
VSNPAIAEELKKKLEETWAKMLPLMLRRLDAIDRAHRALLDGALDDSFRAEAAHEAHKLAGSLGVFGQQEGSQSALEIERVLVNEQILDENALSEFEKHVKKLQSQIRSC